MVTTIKISLDRRLVLSTRLVGKQRLHRTLINTASSINEIPGRMEQGPACYFAYHIRIERNVRNTYFKLSVIKCIFLYNTQNDIVICSELN